MFLSVEQVIEIHEDQTLRYGGTVGIRDLDLLHSAVAVSAASFGGQFLHEDLFHMAAAYAFHISRNHPFLDGNKRTVLAAALVFLQLNGVFLDVNDDVLYTAMMGVSVGKVSKSELAGVFRALAAGPGAHDPRTHEKPGTYSIPG